MPRKSVPVWRSMEDRKTMIPTMVQSPRPRRIMTVVQLDLPGVHDDMLLPPHLLQTPAHIPPRLPRTNSGSTPAHTHTFSGPPRTSPPDSRAQTAAPFPRTNSGPKCGSRVSARRGRRRLRKPRRVLESCCHSLGVLPPVAPSRIPAPPLQHLHP